jgi:5-formyltetrahydrofolate cyclo-ligase
VARQDNIPRGRTIPMGAVPALARGLWHTAPTYLRRRPGSPSNGRLGSAPLEPPDWRSALSSSDADPKALLRRQALVRRRGLAPDVPARLAERLMQEGLRLARLWRPAVVSAFHPIREEPDTLPLVRALAAEGYATALPVVVGRGARLTFRLWRAGEPTLIAGMGIHEPLDSALGVEPDLLFVPLACFDRQGHRIGYGAGYYDRSLAFLRSTKEVHAVGVAYGVCEVASAPYEAHDQSLDVVVTEHETIFVRER